MLFGTDENQTIGEFGNVLDIAENACLFIVQSFEPRTLR